MADTKAIQYIMSQTTKSGNKSSLSQVNFLNADGVATKANINDFFKDLADISVKNGVFNDVAAGDKVISTKASAFALNTLTTIYTGENYKESIREFFSDKKNEAWFESQKIGPEEKGKLLEEIQAKVDQLWNVQAITPEGKKLVDEVKKSFGEAKREQRDKLYEQGLNLVYYTNQKMDKAGKSQEALDSAHDTIKKTSVHSELADKIYESLSSGTNELSREIELSPENTQKFTTLYGRGVKVQPTEFVKRAEKNKLTYEDRVWATEQVKNLTANISDSQKEAGNKNIVINLGDFQMNGKPMFSSVELSNKFPEEISCNIILNIFKGEDVAVKSPDMKEPVHVEPQFVEKENKNRTIWQQIYDFIVNLLTTPEKDKVAAMGKDIAAKSEQNKLKRERVTFAELAGLNSFQKVTAPPAKQKEIELTEIKKAPEMKSR